MRWDNTSGLSPEIENQINDKIKIWLEENQNANGGEDSREVQKLIIELYAIYKGGNSHLNKVQLQQEIIHNGKHWDTDEPALAQIQKYVNRVMKGHYKSANAYVTKVDEHVNELKAEGAKEIIKSTGQAGALKRHEETNDAIDQAKQYYLKNKGTYPTKKAAARDLAIRFPPVQFGTYLNKLKTW